MKQGISQTQPGLPKLAAPAQRALATAGVRSLKDLTKYREVEVRQWHGIGPNALKQLQNALKEQGLSFRQE